MTFQWTKKKVLSLILAGTLFASVTGVYADTLVTPDGKDPAAMEAFIREYIKENYVGDITDDKLNLANYKGLLESLDPYSDYFTPEEYKSFTETLSGEFYGIGVTIESYNKLIRVVSPLEGTPAMKAGLEPGDLITKVNGEDVTKYTLQENVNKIKGPNNTKVTLTVQKAKSGKIVTLDITRAKITVKMVTTKVLNNSIGYIKLTEFGTNCYTEFKKGLDELDSKNTKSLVIDLRNNPGGSLDQVLRIAELFCNTGDEIINIDYKSEVDYKHIDDNPGYNKPIVVLINKGSASASEILTAALKENKHATIVGETSYGKGTVQNIMGLPNGAGIKLTIAEYYGPKMLKINGKGVAPNVEVKLTDLPDKEAVSNLAPFVDSKTYSLNAVNLDVYGAQQRLKVLGYDVVTSAKLDAATATALKKFQATNKMKATGLLDAATKKMLEAKTKDLYTRITSDLVLEKAVELLKNK